MPKEILVAVAVVALVGVAVFMADRSRKRRRFSMLDLSPVSPEDQQGRSLLEEIRGALAAGAPLPSWPGLANAEGDAEIVGALVQAIDVGGVSDWRVLERNVQDVSASGTAEDLSDRLDEHGASERACDLFWQLATESSQPEAVKWGIALGTLHPKEAHAPALEVFGKHPDFARFALLGATRAAAEDASRARALVDLLPSARGWDVVHLVDAIVRHDELVEDGRVQRALLLHSMENSDGLAGEVAFTVNANVDVLRFLRDAASDERTFAACCQLMGALLAETPGPDVPPVAASEKDLVRAFQMLLSPRATDVRVLHALDGLVELLEDESLDWEEREAWLAEARDERERRFSPEVVRAGLRDASLRPIALSMTAERGLTELLPEVEAIYLESLDPGALLALRELGGEREWGVLLESLPRLVDARARAARELAPRTVIEPASAHTMEYAAIARVLGKLGTPDAAEALRTALQDYQPGVREAACLAIIDLPDERMDHELWSIVEARRTDPSPDVAEVAQSIFARMED